MSPRDDDSPEVPKAQEDVSPEATNDASSEHTNDTDNEKVRRVSAILSPFVKIKDMPTAAFIGEAMLTRIVS